MSAPAPIALRNEPCSCPPGHCAEFVEPDADCINRFTGDVRTQHCAVCNPGGTGETWHQDGVCLPCKLRGLS
jgi:hypothetical protein